MIQNSLDLRVQFKQLVREMRPRMRRLMTSLRAAKHRFETFSKPLARTCFVFLRIFELMVRVASAGDGNTKVGAEPRLMWIGETVRHIVCRAMTAGAADEAAHPLRFFDNERYAVTKTHEVLLVFFKSDQ